MKTSFIFGINLFVAVPTTLRHAKNQTTITLEHSESPVSQTTSASKKPAKRGPKPKQIGPLDYCRIYGCWLYVDSTGQSSRSLKATGNLFVEGVTKQKLKMILVLPFRRQLDQSSRVCSPCNNKVRSTYAGFSFIKTSFQESEHYDDSFRFKLKECRHYVDQWFRGKVMQWLKHHL